MTAILIVAAVFIVIGIPVNLCGLSGKGPVVLPAMPTPEISPKGHQMTNPSSKTVGERPDVYLSKELPTLGGAAPLRVMSANEATAFMDAQAAEIERLTAERDIEPLPTPPAEGSVEPLKHEMNCGAWKDPQGNDCGDPCTCGLRWRIALQTEQTMHAAWRKRAEEAEASLFAQSKPVAAEGGLPPLDEDDPEWTLAANEVKRERVSGITEQESDRSLYVTLGSLRIRERQLRAALAAQPSTPSTEETKR